MTVLFIGSPNAGKSTLFNRLTGLGAKTVNYPGSTVDILVGQIADLDLNIQAIDSPGIYSLQPRSPEERITVRSILEHPWTKIVVVVDATQMARQLAIVKQLTVGLQKLGLSSVEIGQRVLVAMTMTDLLADIGQGIRTDLLETELGVKFAFVPAENKELKNSAFSTWLHTAVPAGAVKLAKPDQHASESAIFPALNLAESKRWKDLATSQQSEAIQRPNAREQTRRLDKIILHPLFGTAAFFAIMATLFTFVFWISQPFMELLESVFALTSESILGLAFVDPDHHAVRLLTDGIIAGGGAVAVFIPQIFILFVGLALLEDSGYLSRAATIVDRPLRKVGLGGRSFVPLLAGFACAVPAMIATRTINSRLERIATLFAIPLMSCSARLPVYSLLLALMLPGSPGLAGLVLAALYLGSVISGVVAAGLLSRIMEKREPGLRAQSFLAMELPIYRMPRIIHAARQAWRRTFSYVKRTGPMIILLCILIWGGTSFPHYYTQDPADRLEHSYAGKIGKFLAPVFEPMGGDWRTGLGLISAFAAREVFVSTLAVIFHVGEYAEDASADAKTAENSEEKEQEGLIVELKAAKNAQGTALFTPASIVGLMIFFIIAMQCLSTFAVAIKESGSMRFAVGQLVVFNLAAYVLAVAAVQGLRFVGIP